MSKKMNAVVFDHVGDPGVLQHRQLDIPSVDADSVIVKVQACALNLLDYYLRIEEDPEMPMPHILGSDISGTVHEIGERISGWHIGDEVLVSPAIESEDGRPGIIGYQTQGGYAEFCKVPGRNLVRKPANLSFEEAAAVPLAFVTAYHQVFTRGKVRCGENVLVMGASGGVGSAAVQLCKLAGAFIVGSAGSTEKMAKLAALGADETVNHSSPQWYEKAMGATGGKGFHLICETIGGETLAKCIDLLGYGGRLITVGSTTGSELKLNVNDLFRKQATIGGSYLGTRDELLEVVKLLERKQIRPVVSTILPLAEAAEAHRQLEARNRFGKIVLRIG